jgi:hypothetical protein
MVTQTYNLRFGMQKRRNMSSRPARAMYIVSNKHTNKIHRFLFSVSIVDSLVILALVSYLFWQYIQVWHFAF